MQLDCNSGRTRIQVFVILTNCLENLNILACVCTYLDKTFMRRDQGGYKETRIRVIPIKGHGLNTLTIHPFEECRVGRVHRLPDNLQLITN